MSLKISISNMTMLENKGANIIKCYKFEVETNYEVVKDISDQLNQKLGVDSSILNKRIIVDEGVFIQTTIDPSIFIVSFVIPFALLRLKDFMDIFLVIMEDYKADIQKLSI